MKVNTFILNTYGIKPAEKWLAQVRKDNGASTQRIRMQEHAFNYFSA